MSNGANQGPDYRITGVAQFDANPLIAHLPSPPDGRTDSFKTLSVTPTFNPLHREHPKGIRKILIGDLRKFYVPSLKAHHEAHSGIISQVWDGYLNRNPCTPEGQARLHGLDVKSTWRPTIALISGCSGMGKSTLISRIMSCLGPQLVAHREFSGQPFAEKQILYMRRNIPELCTVKSLCSAFGSHADEILGSRLFHGVFEKLRGGTREQYVHEIRKIMLNYHVGILVLDEFQNLSLVGLGAEKVIAFLTLLRDELGIPILLCGTYKSLELLRSNMAVARRLVEGGYYDLARPGRFEDPAWLMLCKTAWALQWVKEPQDFTEEICAELYGVSQGVTAIMLETFRRAQITAITEDYETVDAALIRRVFDEQMTPLHPAIAALRSNNPEIMAKFDDIYQRVESLQTRIPDDIAPARALIEQLKSPEPLLTPEGALLSAINSEQTGSTQKSIAKRGANVRRSRAVSAEEAKEDVLASKGSPF